MDREMESEIKNLISSILISNPKTSTIQQLFNDFRSIEGQPIPFKKMGFKTLEDYLRSIPDTVKVHGTGPHALVEIIVSSKSEHINEMVMKQKKNKQHKGDITGRNTWRRVKPGALHTNFHPSRPQNLSLKENAHSYNDGIDIERTIAQSNFQWSKKSQENKLVLENPPRVIDKQIEKPVEFKELRTCNQNANQISVADLEESLNEIKNNESLKTTDAHIDYTINVPVNVQSNLKLLIQEFPQGLECRKLVEEYRKKYKKKLVYEEYNYTSLIEMCSNLPKIFNFIQNSSEDYLLFDTNVPLPCPVQKEIAKRTQTEKVSKVDLLEELSKLDWVISSPLIPKDVVTMSDQISRFFPSDIAVGDILDVTLGEVYDLSKFWMYLTFGGLHSLMEELQTFFAENHDRYLIPEALLEEGLYCVALYTNEYHRCVIVNILETQPNLVRVLFVDYGTVSNICTNEIWFLPKQFGELPCQAIRARLSNIYPVFENRPWCALAVARFEKLVANRDLVAEISNIDEKNHVLEVYLADITSVDNVFYLNDVFVKEGLALYTDQEQKPSPTDPNCISNVNYIHLCPDFYDIESGTAPTTEEMKYISANKIPLHQFMPQNFDIYYTEDIDATQLEYEKLMPKKMQPTKIKQIEIEELDFSLFPDSFVERMRELGNQKSSPKKMDSPDTKKEIRIEHHSETSDSVKEYFCNKKRISELIHKASDTKIDDKESENCEGLPSNEFLATSQPMEGALPQHSSLTLSPSTYSSLQSTNPFRSNNSLHNTNPFLSDLEETVNDNQFVNLFTKSSGDILPRKVVNNLKESGKMTKKVNIQRCVPQNVNSIEIHPRIPERPDNIETTGVTRRVRTPPGFSSQRVDNTTPALSPNMNHNFNYMSMNNPYYQTVLSRPLNPTIFAPSTQLVLPLSPPLLNDYCNYLRQMYQNPYNLNSPLFQPFPPHYP